MSELLRITAEWGGRWIGRVQRSLRRTALWFSRPARKQRAYERSRYAWGRKIRHPICMTGRRIRK